MGKFGFNPAKFMHWSDVVQLKDKQKFQTEYKKREPNPVYQPIQKFCTTPYIQRDRTPRNENYACPACKEESKTQTTQNDYMKRHLYIKSCVDKETTEWKFQVQKVSIRNYTPKAINQEINMGMWM